MSAWVRRHRRDNSFAEQGAAVVDVVVDGIAVAIHEAGLEVLSEGELFGKTEVGGDLLDSHGGGGAWIWQHCT